MRFDVAERERFGGNSRMDIWRDAVARRPRFEESLGQSRVAAIVGDRPDRDALLRLLEFEVPEHDMPVARILNPKQNRRERTGVAMSANFANEQFDSVFIAQNENVINHFTDDRLCCVFYAFQIRPHHVERMTSDLQDSFRVAVTLPSSAGALSSRESVRTVLFGVLRDFSSPAAKEIACAQVAVRKLALRNFSCCAVAIVSEQALHQDRSESSGTQLQKVGVSDETSFVIKLQNLRRFLHGDSLSADDIGDIGCNCFIAKSEWDTTGKMQAVLDAAGIDEVESCLLSPSDKEDASERPGSLDSRDGQTMDDMLSLEEDSEERDSFSTDDESWLDRFEKLCANSESGSFRETDSEVADGGPRTPVTSPARRTSDGGTPTRTPTRKTEIIANTPGSGAKFFQRMLKNKR